MASPASAVTLALLEAQLDFTSSTSMLYLQISFQSGGYYETGGLPAGIAALASSLGLNINQFLFADIHGEVATTGGQILMKYIPATDSIQFIDLTTGQELSSSHGIPASVLNDTIIARLVYNRL